MTGIGDLPGTGGINIYPNPSPGIFTITGEQILKVETRNVFGALIQSSYSASIDLSDQPNGIYMVKIITGNGTVTKKIVKN